MTAKDPFIVLARVGAAHGVKGEVRVKLFSEDIEVLTRYGDLKRADNRGILSPLSSRRGKTPDMAIASFEGVTTRDAAEALNGVELGLPRSVLPEPDEDEFYHADLIGLEARLVDGGVFGTILQVANFGADDLLEIKREGSRATEFLPFTKVVVPTVNLAAGYVLVDPPEDEEPEAEDAADGAP